MHGREFIAGSAPPVKLNLELLLLGDIGFRLANKRREGDSDKVVVSAMLVYPDRPGPPPPLVSPAHWRASAQKPTGSRWPLPEEFVCGIICSMTLWRVTPVASLVASSGHGHLRPCEPRSAMSADLASPIDGVAVEPRHWALIIAPQGRDPSPKTGTWTDTILIDHPRGWCQLLVVISHCRRRRLLFVLCPRRWHWSAGRQPS